MKKDKNLLDVVKSLLKELEEDISLLREFDVSLHSEISNFLERMNSRYTSAIEKIVREDDSGYSDLEDILVSVNEMRLQQYQKAAKSMLQMTRKELKNAFWFRDQFSLSQGIGDIEKKILDIDSSSKDSSEIERSINLYRDQINALGGIQKRFQGERHRFRLNIPSKVLLWSIPIFIGIWISDKFDNSAICVLILIMFLFVILSYFFVGSKRFEEFISQNKVMLIIFLVALIVVMFLWQSHTKISSYFYISSEYAAGIINLLFTIMLISILIVLNLPKILAKRKFIVVIPTIDKNFSPRDKIIIPYSLENKRSGVITEVGVSISAPGLDELFRRKDNLYKSMSSKSTKSGELKFLEVPKEAVPGEYTVELEWSFYVGSKWYEKTDRLNINVVS